MDQAKVNPWLVVCRKDLVCLWVWGQGICKSLDTGYFFFSSVVLMSFKEERKSLYIKIFFLLFFKYYSISVYAKASLMIFNSWSFLATLPVADVGVSALTLLCWPGMQTDVFQIKSSTLTQDHTPSLSASCLACCDLWCCGGSNPCLMSRQRGW